MRQVRIEQPEPYKPLYIMEDADGQIWVCAAADHTITFCRLCQRADEMLLALIEHVIDGNMVAKAEVNGELKFKVTAKGKVLAEDLIGSKPEMAMLWAELEADYTGRHDSTRRREWNAELQGKLHDFAARIAEHEDAP